MSELVKVIILAVATFSALYLNIWWAILLLAILYGWQSDFSTLKAGMVAFITVFVLWSLLLYVKDSGFYRSPSELIADIVGGIPVWTVPLIGGLTGGLVAMFGALGGSMLKESHS